MADALNDEAKALRGSRVLILGVAYKKNVGDYRESPALDIIRLLREKGAEVTYHDPHCPAIDEPGLAGGDWPPLTSLELDDRRLEATDVVIVVTDHDGIDYRRLADRARLIVDTRGVMNRATGRARIVSLSGQGEAARRAP